MKKLFGVNSEESENAPLLSEWLIQSNNYLTRDQKTEICNFAESLQAMPEPRAPEDSAWLTDFIKSIGKVVVVGDEDYLNLRSRRVQKSNPKEQEEEEQPATEENLIGDETVNKTETEKPNIELPKNKDLWDATPEDTHWRNQRAHRPLPALPDERSVPTIKLNELVIRPEKFEGQQDKARLWLEDYEAASRANGWTTSVMVRYFSTFLGKSARDWFTAIAQPRITSLTTWYELRAMFIRYYIGPEEHAAIKEEIRRCRQNKDERAIEFIARIMRLLNIEDPFLPEREKVREVKSKLRDVYQDRMIGIKINTLEHLNDLCLEIESRLEVAANRRQYSANNNSQGGKPTQQKNNKQNGKVDKSGKEDQGKSGRSNDKTAKTTYYCKFCKKNGHTEDRCWAKNGKPEKKRAAAVSDKSPIVPLQTEPPVVKVVKQTCSVIAVANHEQMDSITHPCLLNGEEVPIMVDTGSNLSLIRSDVAEKLKLKPQPVALQLVSADGQEIPCLGTVEVEISLKIGKTTKIAKFQWQVVKQLCAPAILGLEAQSWFKLLVRTASREILFEEEATGVRVAKKISLPPRSESIVAATVAEELAGETIAVKPFHFDASIVVANSLDQVKPGGRISCLVANLDNNYIEIPLNTQLGCYEIISASTVDVAQVAATRQLQIPDTTELVGIGEQLDENQVQQLAQLLKAHQRAFSLNGQIGETDIVEHDIVLIPNAKPIMHPLRRRPLCHKEEANRQVRSMLSEGIIEESSSPWASAYVLVRKKNGDTRLCIDFRDLNAQTKKDAFPLPNAEDCIETLGGNRFFSQLDLASGYWQMKVSKSAREYTAFRTEEGHYQFRRMPFGLCNAPASFQKLMNAIFSNLKGLHLQLFLDDLCVATQTWEAHLTLLEQVFELIERANLRLKAGKCTFGAESVIFLGHVISANGVQQDPSKVDAISKLPQPKTAKELQQAMGLFGYYRRFVPCYAKLSGELTNLYKKNVPFIWTTDHAKAFERLREELCRHATLAHFNHLDPVLVKTDASKLGVAGILLQQQKHDWKLITCCSRKLSSAEVNYSISELEGLAMIYTVTRLRNYLLGKRFTLLTDHCALCALRKKNVNNAKLQRWSLILAEYDFEIKYIKGGLHQDVDCLSRSPVDEAPDPYIDDRIVAAVEANGQPAQLCAIAMAIDEAEWKRLTADDTEAQSHLTKARARVKGYKIFNGNLYWENRLYVPQAKRQELIAEQHSESSGHGGVRATVDRLAKLWWPTLADDVRKFVTECHVCQARKTERARPSGSMNSFHVHEPFELVAFDTLGPLPPSAKENRHVIVGIDCFTRFLDAEAVPNLQMETFAKYLTTYIGRFGMPKAILTDNSNFFKNSLVDGIASRFSIELRTSTPHHHEGNSMVERAIQSLQEKVALAAHDPISTVDWEQNLPSAVLSLNTSYHATTRYTPFELMFGRKHQLRSCLLSETVDEIDNFQEAREMRAEMAHAEVVAYQSDAQNRSRQYYDDAHKKREFAVGDLVLTREMGRRAKLQNRYASVPYEIKSRQNDIYTIQPVEGRQEVLRRHISDLKAYHSRNESSVELDEGPSRVAIIRALVVNASTTDHKHQIIRVMNHHFLWILILSSSTIVQSFKFEEASPIVWQRSQAYVSPGPTQFSLLIKFGDACHVLRQFRISDGKEVEKAVLHCRRIFMEQIGNKLSSLAAHTATAPAIIIPSHQPMAGQVATNVINGSPRHKRGLVDFIAGAFVSNVVETVLDRFWPNPTVSSMQEKELLMDQKLEQLNARTNFTALQTKALTQGQELLMNLVKNNVQAVDSITSMYPQLAVVAADLVARHHLLGSHLDQLRASFRMQRPNLELLSLIYLMDELVDIDPDSFQEETIRLSSPAAHMLHAEFVARRRDSEATIYQVKAFRVWVDLLEPNPRVLEYAGPTLLLRNASNSCVRAVSTLQGNYVTARCQEEGYEDQRLTQWKEMPHRSPAEYKHLTTEVIEAWPHVMVNCYPEIITIGNKSDDCPPFPFKLPFATRFFTPSYAHSPSVVEVNAVDSLIPLNFSIEEMHFRNQTHLTTKMAALRKVKQLHENIAKMENQLIAISIPHYPITYRETTYGLIITVGTSLILTIVLMMKKAKELRAALTALHRYSAREASKRRMTEFYEAVARRRPREDIPMLTWR